MVQELLLTLLLSVQTDGLPPPEQRALEPDFCYMKVERDKDGKLRGFETICGDEQTAKVSR